MHRGFIKVYRKIEDWDWFSEPNTMLLFFHLLLMANIADKKWRGVIIKRGDLITSISSLKKRTGISDQSIRTGLKNLKSTNELTIKTTNRFTYISILNYNNYNEVTSQLTNDQQTANKQLTTTKEYKNDKNNKNNTELFEFLTLFNSLFNSKYTQTAGRSKKLSLRLKSFDIDQILLATKNLAASKFHQGKNDRGWKADPDFLIKSDEQIDKWINVEVEKQAKPKIFV